MDIPDRPERFCHAPNERCVMMSECYPAKVCQYEPDESDAEELSRALGGPGFASE